MAEQGCIDAKEKDFLMLPWGFGNGLARRDNEPENSALYCRWKSQSPVVCQPVVVCFLGRMNQGAVLQGDNALPHRGCVVNEFIRRFNIRRLD